MRPGLALADGNADFLAFRRCAAWGSKLGTAGRVGEAHGRNDSQTARPFGTRSQVLCDDGSAK